MAGNGISCQFSHEFLYSKVNKPHFQTAHSSFKRKHFLCDFCGNIFTGESGYATHFREVYEITVLVESKEMLILNINSFKQDGEHEEN